MSVERVSLAFATEISLIDYLTHVITARNLHHHHHIQDCGIYIEGLLRETIRSIEELRN